MLRHRDWRLRVQDIVEYSTEIMKITDGMDFDAFTAQRVVQLAIARCLEIIGEAAHHVPPEVQARCPDVEWRLMNDMRNVLIHAYTVIDLQIVWSAATSEVPRTRDRLVQFLADEQATGT